MNEFMAPINLGGGPMLVEELKKRAAIGGTSASGSATGKKTPSASKSKSGSEVGKDEPAQKLTHKEIVVAKAAKAKSAIGETALAKLKVLPPIKPSALEKDKVSQEIIR